MSLGRNEPCWCGSGKKYKHCHRDREFQQAPNPHLLAKRAQQRRKQGICLHPNASLDACSGRTIDSHTVQRRGSLAAVTDATGHVLSGKMNFADIEKSGGNPVVVKVGNTRASTFQGFCAKHDTELFKPIEGTDLHLDHKSAFLFAFRAVCLELFNKRNAVMDLEEAGALDAGQPLQRQMQMQGYLAAARMGHQKGMEELEAQKALYDDVFSRQAWAEVHYAAVWFDQVLPMALSTGFLPEFDFEGKRLQSLLDFDRPIEHVTINLASYAGKSVVVFAWLGSANGAARAFVDSYLALPSDEQSDALLSTALEITENVYISPDWWGEQPESRRAVLTATLANGTPMSSRAGLQMKSRLKLVAAPAVRVDVAFD